jgi:hypothetical protein
MNFTVNTPSLSATSQPSSTPGATQSTDDVSSALKQMLLSSDITKVQSMLNANAVANSVSFMNISSDSTVSNVRNFQNSIINILSRTAIVIVNKTSQTFFTSVDMRTNIIRNALFGVVFDINAGVFNTNYNTVILTDNSVLLNSPIVLPPNQAYFFINVPVNSAPDPTNSLESASLVFNSSCAACPCPSPVKMNTNYPLILLILLIVGGIAYFLLKGKNKAGFKFHKRR